MATALHIGGWLLLLGTLGTALLQAFSWEGALGLLAILLLILAGVIGGWIMLGLLARATPLLRFGLLLTLTGILVPQLGMAPLGLALMSLWIIGTLVTAGGSLGSVRRTGWRWHNTLFAVAASISFAGLVFFLANAGWQGKEKLVWEPMQAPQLHIDDPGEPGAFRDKPLLLWAGQRSSPRRIRQGR